MNKRIIVTRIEMFLMIVFTVCFGGLSQLLNRTVVNNNVVYNWNMFLQSYSVAPETAKWGIINLMSPTNTVLIAFILAIIWDLLVQMIIRGKNYERSN